MKPKKPARSPLRLCAMEDCRNYLRAPSKGKGCKFCCVEHTAAARRQTQKSAASHSPRPCVHCGELFTPRGAGALYCGPECRRVVAYARTNSNTAAIRAELEASKASGKPAICPVCCALPHRLVVPCPRCGLKPAPLPPVRYEVAMSSPSDWSHAP